MSQLSNKEDSPLPGLFLAHSSRNVEDFKREFPDVKSGSIMECWATPFSYPGADFCVLVIKNKAGTKLESKRVSGY
jgi:hypothetical protein